MLLTSLPHDDLSDKVKQFSRPNGKGSFMIKLLQSPRSSNATLGIINSQLCHAHYWMRNKCPMIKTS